MEISIKFLSLVGAVVLTGLSAGLFYAWQVSVIPGTKRVLDPTYLESMQAINKAILNPAFFLVFFGPVILLILSVIQQYNSGLSFWLLLGAALFYLLGTFGVTVFGNVPLNDTLDGMNLTEMAEPAIHKFRALYERKWNRFHLIRTIFSVLSFLLSVLALVANSNN